MQDYSNYRHSARDTQIWSEDKTFQNQLLYEGEDVNINSGIDIGIDTKCIIRQHTNTFSEIKEDRQILCHNSTPIKRGDYIRNIKNNKSFLIISAIRESLIYQMAKMVECNNFLTIQDGTTLKIHKIPCLLSDKTSVYADGIYDGKLISIPDDQVMITVADNEITRKVLSDKKLIFNNDRYSIYKTKRIDRLTQNGLIFIRAIKDVYNPNDDNLELNISTYVPPVEDPVIPDVPVDPPVGNNYTFELESSYKPNRLPNKTPTTYTAIVKNNGVVVTEPVIYSLENIIMATPIIVSQDGVSCTLSSSTFASGTFDLRVELVSDETIFKDFEIVMGY